MRVRECSQNVVNRADSIRSSGGRGEGEGEKEYWVRLSDVEEVRLHHQGNEAEAMRRGEQEGASMDPTHDAVPAPAAVPVPVLIATHLPESPPSSSSSSSSLLISIPRSHDIHHSETSLDTFCPVPTAHNQPYNRESQEGNDQDGKLPSVALAADLNISAQNAKRTRRKMRRAGKQCALAPSLDLNAMHDNQSLHCAVGESSSVLRSDDNYICDGNEADVCAAECCPDETERERGNESDMTHCSPSPSPIPVQTSLLIDEVASFSFADLFSDMLSSRRSQMAPD